MMLRHTIRKGAFTVAACALLAAPLCAQVSSYADKSQGVSHGDELPTVLKKTKVEQRLNQPLPLDAKFVDETGKPVKLGDYFGDHKPAVLALVYFNCKMLCSEELDGLVQSLAMVKLDAGKDFNIIVASIDTTDTPDVAAKKKAIYVRRYDRAGSENGWHFLTSTDQASIDALTQATGFSYVRVPGPDGKLDQFAHASAIQLITPQGRIAQYYMGVDYSPKDMLLGLIESSGNKIGSPVANILTYCYHYDPQSNTHSLIVARVVQLGGMVTLAGLGGFLFVMFKKDIKLGRDHSLTRRNDDIG